MPKPDYDTTLARIAGNILSGYRGGHSQEEADLVQFAVALARAIVAEVKRTTPQPLAGLTENRGIVGQTDPRAQAGNRLETEG